MHFSPHSAWGYVWGCTPHIPHHWDVGYDGTLTEVGKGARHSVSDRQLRFRFLGKDRYRKTSEPHLLLQFAADIAKKWLWQQESIVSQKPVCGGAPSLPSM